MLVRTAVTGLFLCWATLAVAEIPKPTDAPQAYSPAESAKMATLPPGFHLELVASEPLINEVSGMCWDERGRLIVCELHGYNVEGQLDVDELNKTGELDLSVRRIHASEDLQKKALKETYGVVKLLTDTDGDGVMDKAEVWADHLQPCYGICAARNGVIIVAAPDIVYIADNDGDGKPDVHETLFTGLLFGALERGTNCPEWQLDNWIYCGRGHGGSRITGPHLKSPVEIPRTDFRIKSDGSAIEAVSGDTRTIGFTTTDWGGRIVPMTQSAAEVVAPLSWRYLARNPDIAIPDLIVDGVTDRRCYPTSKSHPWRTKRADNPGYRKFYGEKEVNHGVFTSLCSPLIYRDTVLPGLYGQEFACEPAQNLITRGIIGRRGTMTTFARAPGEESKEFLASADAWFHPMFLAHGPDGGIYIADFYREIIEDYSAIPRYLQQQYGLTHGHDRGRVWRLAYKEMPKAPPADMNSLSSAQLAAEVAGKYQWRRETARRMLIDRKDVAAAPFIAAAFKADMETIPAINALYTLDGLDKMPTETLITAMDHKDPSVRVHALQLADRRFDAEPKLFDKALTLLNDKDPLIQLQLALSLGESHDPRSTALLAQLARDQGAVDYLPLAVLSSLSNRAGVVLADLISSDKPAGSSGKIIEPLCAAIANRHDADEFSAAIEKIANIKDEAVQAKCIRGFKSAFKKVTSVTISDSAREALKKLADGSSKQVAGSAKDLMVTMRIESAKDRADRLAKASATLVDTKLDTATRLAAMNELATEDDPKITKLLLDSFANATPPIREAIMGTMIGRNNRYKPLVIAMENGQIPPSALTAVQREALLSQRDGSISLRAELLFKSLGKVDEETFTKYTAALKNERDVAHGAVVFREKCANCHQARGMGFAVGPNLEAEFQRAEETFVKDILAPSDTISAGFVTYQVVTEDGLVIDGLLSAETASSVTLRQPGGKSQTVLRKDIDQFRALPTSIMPEDLAKQLGPKDVADVVAWLRSPPTTVTLIDSNVDLLASLNQGDGKAEFVDSGRENGKLALRVTPPQRSSAHIKGWSFPIREKPGPGEYRYLRVTWKTDGATGIMLELAHDGRWPSADAAPFRYYAGPNTTPWKAIELSPTAPRDWTTVTCDVWKDGGDCTLTGIAPTVMTGPGLFERVELLQNAEGN